MTSPWKASARVYDPKAKQTVTINLSVDIDWEAIAQKLARRALKSKHRRATLIDGAIKARIV